MKRPSERALALAEEILDHVRYGLTRADALHELADMIDESNAELLQAARGVVGDAARNGNLPGPEVVARLKETLREYQPLRPAASEEADLFPKSSPAPTLF